MPARRYASALDRLRPRHDGVPGGVHLPTFLVEGPLTWPGQHAGFLGPRHDPWQINADPNRRHFRVDGLPAADVPHTPMPELAAVYDFAPDGLHLQDLWVHDPHA